MRLSPALTAAEAAARLGVSRQTLYAYVSRGLLRAHPAEGSRQSRYAEEEVDSLAARAARGRKPRDVARAALDWGTPVLTSGLTLIERGRLSYRGHDALTLADTATAEDVAALLWNVPVTAAFPAYPPEGTAVPSHGDLLARFAAATGDDACSFQDGDPNRSAADCGGLIRIMAACLLGHPPSAAPLHVQCAQGWSLDGEGERVIRMALVLCADHELNASTFTARCIASTGAGPRAVVTGGLAALSGPLHGGTTARIETFWDRLDATPEPETVPGRCLAEGEDIPGFGHPLYPDGDIRARALLAPILSARPAWAGWIGRVTELTGRHPNIDLALVASRRHLRLPRGAAFGLFALSRAIGWIAHALEQRADPRLIRPRAIYAGPAPG